MYDLTLLLRLLVIAAAAVLFLVLVSLAGLYSAIRPAKITSPITPRELGLAYKDITLQTNDGLALAGWYIPHQDRHAPAVILLHGYPADKGNILPPMAFLSQRYHLLLFDFRYLGQSRARYSTAGARETADLDAALAWLAARGHSNIGLWGFSLGGAVALMAAPHHPEVKAVVAEASYADLYDLIPQLYPLPGLRYPLAWLTRLWAQLLLSVDVREVAPAQAAARLSIPVLIIHSTSDRVIPFNHAQRLQEALQGNPQAEFWFRDDLGHGQLADDYRQRVENFFARHLADTLEE